MAIPNGAAVVRNSGMERPSDAWQVMDGAEAFFPNYASVAEMRVAIRALLGQNVLTNVVTRSPSFLTGFTDGGVTNRYLGSGTPMIEKIAAVAEWWTSVLKLAMPREEILWSINRKVIVKCSDEVIKQDYDALRLVMKESKGKDMTEQDQLALYRNSATRFRNAVDPILLSTMKTMTGHVPLQVPVANTQLAAMADLLTEISAKRAKRLQGGQGPARPTSRGLAHHSYYEPYVANSNLTNALADLKKRSSNGQGLIDDEFPAQGAKRGTLLLTSTIVHMISSQMITRQALARDTRPAIVKALAEIDSNNMLNNERQQSQFAQQCANIDPIFNFYMWMSIVGAIEVETVANEKNLTAASWSYFALANLSLYGTCLKLQSYKKLKDIVNFIGGPIAKIAEYASDTGHIYMPPYALNWARIPTILGSYFGGLHGQRIMATFYEPGINTRAIIGFKATSPIALQYILHYHLAINATNGDTDINDAEHCFHQMLMDKTSGLANTIGLEGNIFGIEIVQAGDGHQGYVQNSMRSLRRASGIDFYQNLPQGIFIPVPLVYPAEDAEDAEM